jgi:hypothetical protein
MLVHRLQYHGHGALQDLVLERRNPDRSSRSILLREVYAPHRRSEVAPRPGTLQQRTEVVLQVRRIGFGRLPVHPHRPVFTGAAVGFPQPVQVQVMSQRGERQLRRFPRQFRYPLLFREDGAGARSLRRRSQQRFHKTTSPFLHRVSRGAGFPCFTGTTRRSDAPPPVPPRFVSFAWRYLDCTRHSIPPLTRRRELRSPVAMRLTRKAGGGVSRDAATAGQGSLKPAPPVSGTFKPGDGGASQVPGESNCGRARLSDPGGTATPDQTRRCDAAFGFWHRLGSHGYGSLGAQYPGPSTRCLRFAGWITPPPRKTRFRPLVR